MKCWTREIVLWVQSLLSSRKGLSFNPRTHRKARCGGLCL